MFLASLGRALAGPYIPKVNTDVKPPLFVSNLERPDAGPPAGDMQ
jgi:hypothetical protein